MLARPNGYEALPKRFKDHIRNLELKIAALRRMVPRTEKTRVRVIDAMHRDEDTYLPDDTAIEFMVNGFCFEVQRARNNYGLSVRATTGSLAVEPNVSNDVTIVARKL